jgi:hypothetical protein
VSGQIRTFNRSNSAELLEAPELDKRASASKLEVCQHRCDADLLKDKNLNEINNEKWTSVVYFGSDVVCASGVICGIES